jgi:hypothetical protein
MKDATALIDDAKASKAGIALARRFFEKRKTSRVEAHLSEHELACILGVAFQLGVEHGRKTHAP